MCGSQRLLHSPVHFATLTTCKCTQAHTNTHTRGCMHATTHTGHPTSCSTSPPLPPRPQSHICSACCRGPHLRLCPHLQPPRPRWLPRRCPHPQRCLQHPRPAGPARRHRDAAARAQQQSGIAAHTACTPLAGSMKLATAARMLHACTPAPAHAARKVCLTPHHARAGGRGVCVKAHRAPTRRSGKSASQTRSALHVQHGCVANTSFISSQPSRPG